MKNQPITLEAIKRLLNETLDQKFKVNNQILIAAFDKDYKYLEGKINTLDDKVENFRTEVNKRFDEVDKRFDVNDDTHQIILGTIGEVTDSKLEKHCREKHSFAAA